MLQSIYKYSKNSVFSKIKKHISNPSILPGIIVIAAAVFCGGKNIIQRNRKSANFLLSSETGFWGGADDLIEEVNSLDDLKSGETDNAFALASLQQPLTVLSASAETIESYEPDISAMAAMSNPNNPAYADDSEGLREEIIKYTVVQGDTISAIAEKFGVSTNTILWANNLTASSVIKPGNQLDILPMTGVKHTVKSGDTLEAIAKKYDAPLDEIEFFNGISANENLEAGKIVVVPGGVLPQSMQPKPDPAKIASKPAPAAAKAGQTSGYFIYPAAGHNWGRIHAHNGIDISNAKGGPIYAAASGTVILADAVGYNGGYGEYVQIKHPNGVVTLYGHLSKIYVKVGQSVKQGDVIGMMGNTGRSTGTHLHFEVRGARNPLARY